MLCKEGWIAVPGSLQKEGFDALCGASEQSSTGMTIAHRTRRSSNSLVHSEDRVSDHNEIDDPSEVNVAVEEIRLRGCADLPPKINNEQDRPLIEPEGKSHWTDVKGRTPASVLTVLLKRNHPGLIEYGGKVVVAST